MAETVIIISVILIFLLILVQDISIRLIYKNGLSIEIDYSFFTLTLSDIKSKGGFSGISPKLFPKLKRRIEFLLRNARLEITEIHLSTSEDDPRKFSLIYKNLFSLFALITVYLSKKIKKLNINDSAIIIESAKDADSDYRLDIKASAPLYVTVSLASLFLPIALKNKKSIRKKSYVGKQNE